MYCLKQRFLILVVRAIVEFGVTALNITESELCCVAVCTIVVMHIPESGFQAFSMTLCHSIGGTVGLAAGLHNSLTVGSHGYLIVEYLARVL